MDKQAVRTTMKKKRDSEPQNSIVEKSKLIENKLLNHPFYRKARNVLFYVSYGNEVHTHNLIKDALQGEKNVYVPVSDTETKTLKISYLSSWVDLTPSAYSILEPRKEKQRFVPFQIINLIIVPGIAFDRKGNRLGHGGGFYDWLICKLPTVQTIGLAFSFQIVDELPVESSDQKVRMIITEDKIIDCLGDKFS